MGRDVEPLLAEVEERLGECLSTLMECADVDVSHERQHGVSANRSADRNVEPPQTGRFPHTEFGDLPRKEQRDEQKCQQLH